MMKPTVYRFAPSPNGHLHLGHALSAWLNFRAAQGEGGRFLLRVEDIDRVRCTPALVDDMIEDLAWLGLSWEEPVYRQSEHFDTYAGALEDLEARELVYRAYLTRGEVKRFVEVQEAGGRAWPRDPDGAPLYPGDRTVLSEGELSDRREAGAPYAMRLDMTRALSLAGTDLSWWEGPSDWECTRARPALWMEGERISESPERWGDVILARKDTPTSYHLAVVLDDALQGVTDVVRGKDLFAATSVHRLLQELLGLPAPRYRHHRLILGADGKKLSKSNDSTSLRSMRESGVPAHDVLQEVAII